jgi:hypothetical protein
MRNVLALVTAFGLCRLYGQTSPKYLVTVHDVKTTPSADNGAPGMKEDVFFVKFQATLRNSSDHIIFVSAEPLISDIAEILLPSGEWKPMMLSNDVFETGDEKYPPCTIVEPGKAFTFPNVRDIIVLRRDRPTNRTATFRFPFHNVCMVGSARRSTNFITESIQINH